MSQREFERAPAPRRSVGKILERLRVALFAIPPKLRLLLFAVALGGSAYVAAGAGWPVGRTLVLVAAAVVAVAFTLAYPRRAATASVFAVWVAATPFMTAAYQRVAAEHLTRDAAALVLLGIVVCLLAHAVPGSPPWQHALASLVPAGVVGTLLVLVVPPAEVIPTCVIAFAVLIYRWVARPRTSEISPPEPERVRGRQETVPPPQRVPEEPPPVTSDIPDLSVDEALAELDNMIGLEPVKRQVHAIAAALEAARLRAEAGLPGDKPMRHFVFLGPAGTGKTTVARIIAKIFYALGLLERPVLAEVQRADLVGEYLGATALKTNRVVDAALGGVLFVDEAYGLINTGDGQSDRFGSEAVQTLLKRAEDDRENLVIILAGYEREMDDFLGRNPGLESRFATRVRFPTYSPTELFQIAESLVAARGQELHPDAVPALWSVFEDVTRRGIVDELGNGRFVRSLIEVAADARDVRVMDTGRQPQPADLITLRSEDIEAGFAVVGARFGGGIETPSLEQALSELDDMIGLEPVKRQVRAIAARLDVARARTEQGLIAARPMRHFVFLGPPGTGKTTVARILARVFAALGLLSRPAVVEAHRPDLVGEHLGSTAIKTNTLVDRALDGVLFIDEAYSLWGEGYTAGDAFGGEAISTLLKRAEDDRDRLVVILAGYADEMGRFLARNPGLASRFATRVTFPGYRPEELKEIALHQAKQGGDRFDTEAHSVLGRAFAELCDQGRIDGLGNARFVRTLYETACAARDLRLVAAGSQASVAELTTITGDDLRAALDELSP